MDGILNLSRLDPAKISTGFGSQTYFHAVGGSGPLTFISTIRVGDCHLIDPKPSANGRMQRLIEGALVEGEWERLVGAIGQVIDKSEYKAQIQAGYVSFATSFANPVPGELFHFLTIFIMLITQQELPPLLICMARVVPAVPILLPGVPALAV